MPKYSQFLLSGVSKVSDQGEPQIASCKQYKLAKLLQVSQILFKFQPKLAKSNQT